MSTPPGNPTGPEPNSICTCPNRQLQQPTAAGIRRHSACSCCHDLYLPCLTQQGLLSDNQELLPQLSSSSKSSMFALPTAATAGQVLASKKRQSIANGTVIEVNLGNRSAFSPEDRRISIAGGSHETAGTEAQQKLSASTSMHQLYISGPIKLSTGYLQLSVCGRLHCLSAT